MLNLSATCMCMHDAHSLVIVCVCVCVCVSLQTMTTDFPDILNEGETVEKFVEVTALGKDKVDRVRAFVHDIAIRYVEKHGQHYFEIQTARRLPLSQSPTPPPAATTTSARPEAVTPTATTTVATPETVTPAVTPDVFVDSEWVVELEDVQVQELDGTWRDVIVFRHIDGVRVCLWFGKNEYEGIDPGSPYRFCPRSEILEDDEGFDINWRIRGIENDDDDDDDDDEDHD